VVEQLQRFYIFMRGFQKAAKILYFVDNSLLFPNVKEFSKMVNSF